MPVMNLPFFQPNLGALSDSPMQPGSAATEVWLSAAHNIQLIQAHAGAELFTRTMDSVVPALAPDGLTYWTQQAPELARQQGACVMNCASGIWEELLQVQQKLTEMVNQSLWRSVQAGTEATAQGLNRVYTRRVASQVIAFPDRRAA